MNRRKSVIYLVVPLATTLALIAAYFSGVETLQRIVSPEMPGVHPDSPRELGLLENLQNVCLIASIVFVIRGFKRKSLRWERVLLWAMLAGLLFVTLEEIDYGRHYYELMRGIGRHEAAQVRNLHNIGDMTDILKALGDIGIGIFFVILPLCASRIRAPRLRHLIPDRWSIATVAAMLAASTLAHALRDANVGTPGSMDKNISEFRELFLYYLVAVYVFEIVYRRRYGD